MKNSLSDQERIDKVEDIISKLDQLIERLHNFFDLYDREIQPVLNDINHARMGLENIKITLERRGANKLKIEVNPNPPGK